MVKATAQPYKLLTYSIYNIQQQSATQDSNDNPAGLAQGEGV